MRKNLLADLVAPISELTAVNSDPPQKPARAAPLGSKGAVGAMSRALAQITSDREIPPRTDSEIVEIDAALIVDSAYRDRLGDPGAAGASLVASIREAGQQVPILVRPSPGGEGRYQIAYGHRRVAALREIGRPVRALVRPLTDDEMIVAQGAENGARRDLSFIERAYFAWTLEAKGIARTTITAALSVDKTELSRLISVMRAVPSDLVEAIGPAPRAGRRRWMDLAERVSSQAVLDEARRVTATARFLAIEDSDARFLSVFAAGGRKRARPAPPKVWTDEFGRKLARAEWGGNRFVLSIDEVLEPAFGDYIFERLPALLDAFRHRSGCPPNDGAKTPDPDGRPGAGSAETGAG